MAYGAIPGDASAAEAPQQRCKVAVAILLCLLTISVVPLANKAVLKRGANGAPLAMTACQLLGAAWAAARRPWVSSALWVAGAAWLRVVASAAVARAKTLLCD